MEAVGEIYPKAKTPFGGQGPCYLTPSNYSNLFTVVIIKENIAKTFKRSLLQIIPDSAATLQHLTEKNGGDGGVSI